MEFFRNLLDNLGEYALFRLLPAFVIFVIGSLIVRILTKLLRKGLDRTKLDKSAISLLCSVVRIALLILISLVAVSFLGIDVTGIVALASVLTLAISLSVQDALTNLIGGFTLINTKPFAIEDYVEIGGQAGTVKKIGLTYTQLLTPDGKTVSMPNSTVVAAQIINYTVNGTRRVDVTVQAGYDNDPELVLQALVRAADLPDVLSDPEPYCAIDSYGDSAVSYALRVWTDAGNYVTTLHAINRNIHAVFKEMGVTMTYPHLNVHIKQ